MFSKRADGVRASKRKRSPSPSLSPMSKAPHNGSSHKKQQAENGAEASTSTSEGPVLPHTENAAAATVGPSNTVYGGTRAPNSESSTTTRPARPQPQPTMTGVAPNKMPEKAAAPSGIALPGTGNQATSATLVYPARSNVVYPASNNVVYPASSNVVYPASNNVVYPASSNVVYPASNNVVYPASSNVVYPASNNVVYPASNNVVYPASNNVVNSAASPSTIPAYSLARRRRPCDDFELLRQSLDSVSSTGAPSNGPKNPGT